MTQELRDMITKAIGKAYQLGQIYWQQADSDFESQHKKADVTSAKFKVLQAETNEQILALLDRVEKAEKDAARLDWMEQNLFNRENVDWISGEVSKTHNMWVTFAPVGVQGSARRIIDSAMEASK